jgi:hypothetical protein
MRGNIRTTLFALALAAIVALAGCGSGDGEKAGSSPKPKRGFAGDSSVTFVNGDRDLYIDYGEENRAYFGKLSVKPKEGCKTHQGGYVELRANSRQELPRQQTVTVYGKWSWITRDPETYRRDENTSEGSAEVRRAGRESTMTVSWPESTCTGSGDRVLFRKKG